MTNYLPKILLVGLLVLLVAGCAPGNSRYSAETGRPANFWAGLWHGLIIVITFIVSLFTNDVQIYESNNVGWGYNLGFILGCCVSLGGAARGSAHKRKRREADWDRVGRQIGDSIKEGLASWRKEERATDSDWDELGRKIEERIREEMRKARG
ncbi:hypothetical protein JXD38_02975 [candidate division WOR-3 bacterium]|nr:hypothetical protein [candidate division WOR-3 bacterium]